MPASNTAPTLDRLRAELERRFGGAVLPQHTDARVHRPGFRTGVDAPDRLLPDGIPRGAVSLWWGEVTSGRTAALRALVERALAVGARVALVDATRTLDPAPWSFADERRTFWVVRAPSSERAAEGAWVAEALLRAAIFDLIVLDGVLPTPVELHRLRALAQASDAALLVSTGASFGEGRTDVRLEFRRDRGGHSGLRVGGRFRRHARVQRTRGVSPYTESREVELVCEPADCLRAGSFTPDRRAGQRG